MLRGSGLFPKPPLFNIILLFCLIIILNSSKKIFYFVLLPFILIYALYTPVGLNFGKPTYAYIASLFATDISESKEFLLSIPYKSYLYAIAIPILLLLFRYISQKFHIALHKNKLFLSCLTITMLFNTPVFDFFRVTNTEYQKVKVELDRLNNIGIKNEWGETKLTNKSKYDDYVLIIGESARKDYHYVYGYPINNTPFISSSKAVIVDGFEPAGLNTVPSLKRILTNSNKKTGDENYNLNLIDLINSAGIDTYWISNQGGLGRFDTPISAIGKRSHHQKFLKNGQYSDKNTSDFLLLPELQKVLNQSEKQKRFIVLHLYGSHVNACDRIKDYKKLFNDNEIDKKYGYLNCYISSIKKTDEFIKLIYNKLTENGKQTGRKFSMIYFSDHGLSHKKEQSGIIVMSNANLEPHHYEIPLFKLSSDDVEQTYIKAYKSPLNFTNGIANWIGISNAKLDPNYDLFSDKADKRDDALMKKLHPLKGGNDISAIDITKPLQVEIK